MSSWRSFPARWRGLLLALLAAGPAQDPRPPADRQPIRVGVDLVTTDVRVRDTNGRFVANLGKGDFEVYEDGVRQEIVSFLMSHGGRLHNVTAPPPAPLREGVLIPARPITEAAGRIFVVFIDDAHLDPSLTVRVRNFLRSLSRNLIHDGDMFAAVSTGTSAIEVPLTYDRSRLDAAVNKVMGNGLTPNEIIAAPASAQGNAELRHKAHVAFRTAWDITRNLEQIQHRRKAFIYVSSGYDYAPFEKARARLEAQRYGRGSDPGIEVDPFTREGTRFSEADLAMELAELIRAANRASATIYPIDPRGLAGGPDLNQNIDMVEWQNHVTSSQNSLRALADSTGGFATVNRNDLEAALKRIDQETSDYYMIGYYSSNPDPAKRRRGIEVRIRRANVDVHHRTEYVLRR